MLKKTFFLFFLFLLFTLNVSSIFAVEPTCGYAGTDYGKCCTGELTDQLNAIDSIAVFGTLKSAVTIVKKFINIDGESKEFACAVGEPTSTNGGSECQCVISNLESNDFCNKYLVNSKELSNCNSCISSLGYYSALGCVQFNSFSSFVSTTILRVSISLGGIALIFLIIYAVFLIQTSAGDPKKIENAKSIITSAIIGLLFIIFSVFILKFFGMDVLGIKFS